MSICPHLHNDGSRFMEEFTKKSDGFTPILHQEGKSDR